MVDRHLIVFAKPPRLGAVKSRLARDIGMLAAWRFYRASLEGVIAEVARDPRWRTVLCVTPGAARWPPDVALVPQCRGDLGTRMSRAMRRMPPGPVVLIGSDIPGLRRCHVARAFAALGRTQAVFGPADDGGFWLVGLRHPRRRPYLFENVRWSSAEALADTLANVADYELVDELCDVDTGADFERAQADSRSRGINSAKLHGLYRMSS